MKSKENNFLLSSLRLPSLPSIQNCFILTQMDSAFISHSQDVNQLQCNPISVSLQCFLTSKTISPSLVLIYCWFGVRAVLTGGFGWVGRALRGLGWGEGRCWLFWLVWFGFWFWVGLFHWGGGVVFILFYFQFYFLAVIYLLYNFLQISPLKSLFIQLCPAKVYFSFGSTVRFSDDVFFHFWIKDTLSHMEFQGPVVSPLIL